MTWLMCHVQGCQERFAGSMAPASLGTLKVWERNRNWSCAVPFQQKKLKLLSCAWINSRNVHLKVQWNTLDLNGTAVHSCGLLIYGHDGVRRLRAEILVSAAWRCIGHITESSYLWRPGCCSPGLLALHVILLCCSGVPHLLAVLTPSSSLVLPLPNLLWWWCWIDTDCAAFVCRCNVSLLRHFIYFPLQEMLYFSGCIEIIIFISPQIDRLFIDLHCFRPTFEASLGYAGDAFLG